SLRVCLRLPAYSASAKVICFIEKLGDWCPEILPNQEVFFRISQELFHNLPALAGLFQYTTNNPAGHRYSNWTYHPQRNNAALSKQTGQLICALQTAHFLMS
ncbi:hypothetical protein, partial [Pseudomonas syringae]|uniref:hypothetical protein n=1 Tax=Pseudomonas syringae TaxID=317 RepID=UPI0019D6ECBA